MHASLLFQRVDDAGMLVALACRPPSRKERHEHHALLIIILIILLIGGGGYGLRSGWGGAPVGGIGLVVVILIVLLVMGVV